MHKMPCSCIAASRLTLAQCSCQLILPCNVLLCCWGAGWLGTTTLSLLATGAWTLLELLMSVGKSDGALELFCYGQILVADA